MKTLYLMQGVPGSGKSTIAHAIEYTSHEQGKSVKTLSTDTWRFDGEGIYVYDPADNQRYHTACQKACVEEMQFETEIIIIDNTNIQEWQTRPYTSMAGIYDYLVQVVSVDCGLKLAIDRQLERPEDRRVPPDVIAQMWADMERVLS